MPRRPAPRRGPSAALLILAAVLSAACSARREAPTASDGLLDLRSWDFRDGHVALTGTWEFFPALLLAPDREAPTGSSIVRRVPDLWSGGIAGGPGGRGAGTYRLRILLPPEHGELAVSYTTVSTAFELYAVNRRIGGAGAPSTDPAAAVAAYSPGTARLPIGADGVVDLLVLVSNHEYRSGGMWRSLVLGPAEAIVREKTFRFALSLGLGSGFISLAVHFFILFLFRRRERTFGYFSAFIFLIGLRTLLSGEYALPSVFPGLPFGLVIRLEYITAYLSIPAGMLFFGSLCRILPERTLRLCVLLPHAPFVALIPAAPLPLLTSSIVLYYPLAAVTILVLFFLLGWNYLRERDACNAALLVAGSILAAAAVNDMLHASFTVQTLNLLPYALALFVLLQHTLLARKFTAAFDREEQLSHQLSQSNDLLRRELEGHREARSELEMLLAEKETHLKEIHHRVKNSLQIVSSIAALQAHRAEDDAAAEALDSLRERIRAISLVHEKLYEAPAGGLVDAGDYLNGLLKILVAGLWDSSGSDRQGILDLRCDDLKLPMELCVDIGLILGELATNAIRHGFKTRSQNTFSVRVEKGTPAGLRIAVSDSGPGYPENFDPGEGQTLGFKIIRSLVRKRNGSMEILGGPEGGIVILIP